MSIPLSSTGNVFDHRGGKLENRQFLAKMHQIAPKVRLKLQNFPASDTPGPPSLGRGHLSPDPSLLGTEAPRLVAFGHSMVPLKETAGQSPDDVYTASHNHFTR